MKHVCIALLLFLGQEAFSQNGHYTIRLKSRQVISFDNVFIWADTAFMARPNQRYFFFLQDGKLDSVPTKFIASVTEETNDPKQKKWMATLFGQLSMDCDLHNVGDLIIRNFSQNTLWLAFHRKGGRATPRLRKWLTYPKEKETDWDFPAGEYSYVLTYKGSGKVYKRGVMKMECCKTTILTIE